MTSLPPLRRLPVLPGGGISPVILMVFPTGAAAYPVLEHECERRFTPVNAAAKPDLPA
ncbi:hypothetical protein GCM10009099_32730 [Caenispirillum bisanense]